MPSRAPAQPQAPALAVGAVVLDGQKRVLLVRRKRPPSAQGWTLPGGRVEPGESLERAIERELLEETGLTVRVLCELCVVTLEREGFAYRIHEHLALPVGDPSCLRAGDDAAAVRWTPRGELAALGVAQDAVAVIDLGIARAQPGATP